MTEWDTVIGLEVHLQFNTHTKIFCGCANLFGAEPNTLTCPVCLGLPGSLPVVNRQALDHAIKVALALNCRINPLIKFDRKNYYYPDLPKGYQISQFDLPIGSNGHLVIRTRESTKRIGVKRAHLEEDAGKLVHDPVRDCSLVDYNRTGTPLMEIVSEPDLNSPDEAYAYLTLLKLTLQYLNVSDCDMEKGSLRCDANISVRPNGTKTLGTKTEIKNLNSFRAVRSALAYEETRQRKLLSAGESIVQETRLWNDQKQTTTSMRSKEEAHDYRYFPEPDLVPFMAEDAQINALQSSIPELPSPKLVRLITQYGLREYDALILIQDQFLADFFEECVTLYKDAQKICNWINGALLKELNARKARINAIRLAPREFVALIAQVENGTISNLGGKEALTAMIDSGRPAETVIREKGLIQLSDEGSLQSIVDEILKDNTDAVKKIESGDLKPVGFLIGQAMKKTGGKANPKMVGEIIRRRLNIP